MIRSKRRWWLAAELFLALGVAVLLVALVWDRSPRPDNAITMKVQLPDVREKVYLHELVDGTHRFRITSLTGRQEDLTAEAFAARLHQAQRSRGFWSQVMNISSPAGAVWVVVGLLGQVLFTGRMVVQWIASEKDHRSVVPPVFWWMSLGGATMLMVYFIWRKDVVGVIGQSAGWFIYVRNLWLIYQCRLAAPKPASAGDAGRPERT